MSYPDTLDNLTELKLNGQTITVDDYIKLAKAVNALQRKVGVVAAIPDASMILASNASGQSLWRKIAPTDISLSFPWVDANALGALGDGKVVTDGAITTGTATLTSATAAFVAADVGKLVTVVGAGAAGAILFATISAFVNTTTVTLSTTAGTTVSGATVNYGTDNAGALQAAINTVQIAPYGMVLIKPGRYMTSLNINHRTNVWLTGTGRNATVLVAAASAVSVLLNVGNSVTGSRTEHLTLDGNGVAAFSLQLGTNNDDTVVDRVTIRGGTSRNFSQSGSCVNSTFRHVTFTDPAGTGIDGLTTGGVTFERCRFIRTTTNTARQLNIQNNDTNVLDCIFDGNTYSAQGVYLSSSTSPNRTKIQRNTFRNSGAAGNAIFADAQTTGCSNLLITNNQFYNCGINNVGAATGGVISLNTISGAAPGKNIVISNNAIDTYSNLDGIFVSEGYDGVVIANNVQSGSVDSGNASSNAIESHAINAVISGNVIRDVQGHGIWVGTTTGNNMYTRVFGNVVRCTKPSAAVLQAVVIAGSEVTVESNIITGDLTASSVGIEINASAGTSNHNLVNIKCTDNRIYNCATGIQQDQSGGFTLTGVILNDNDLTGCTAALSAGFTATVGVVRNNKGYNPVGPSAITVTASPFTYTASASPEEIYAYGGTVSSVTKGGTTIAQATPFRVHLEPGQSIVTTYSVAPTMNKDTL